MHNELKISVKDNGDVQMTVTQVTNYGRTRKKQGTFTVSREQFQKAMNAATIEVPWREHNLLKRENRQ
jgi:hypothetical protein